QPRRAAGRGRGGRRLGQAREQGNVGQRFLKQDMVEEVQGAGGLRLLKKRGARIGAGQVREESGNLDGPEFEGMAFLVEENEAPNPVDKGANKTGRVTPGVECIGELIEQPGRGWVKGLGH